MKITPFLVRKRDESQMKYLSKEVE